MTCANGERGDRCTYEPRQRSHRTNASALPISCEAASHDLILPSKPPATVSSVSESLTRPSLGTPHLIRLHSSESLLLLPPPLVPSEGLLAPSFPVHDEMLLGPSSDIRVVQDIHSTTKCFPHPTVSSFTVLPSINFQRIPWPLPVPLSLVPPERVQISSAGSDLDMILYVVFRFLNSDLVV